MKSQAIIYTSNTGHTMQYARLLGEKTGLPVYELSEAKTQVAKDTDVIYLGWLMASMVKGYSKAIKQYKISAVCGVGLCDTGSLLEEVRKNNNIPTETPVFTLQGGMDHSKLRGMNKFMINMLTKSMASKENRTEDEEKMLTLLQKGGNYVCEENLQEVLKWYNK